MAKKQMKIELVTDVKDNGELVKETFNAPNFIPFSKLIEVTKKLEGLEDKSEMEAMEETFGAVVELYNHQFTVKQLMDGLDSREAVAVIQENIEYLSTGTTEKAKQAENKSNLQAVTK
ncbi:phage tail assembly chaperone G [Staphylococcus epidermidis]|uniref:phage tail assembly chaperone G n=1 Tax=Staphylococcus epidermidis TaxID=1282 RepID=UPI00273A48B9|nr:hypothetical protein [Staphylococcus epidermidis]